MKEKALLMQRFYHGTGVDNRLEKRASITKSVMDAQIVYRRYCWDKM